MKFAFDQISSLFIIVIIYEISERNVGNEY